MVTRRQKFRKEVHSEEELCEYAINWLEKNGYEVYQEVIEPFYSGRTTPARADIVAVRDNSAWIIEAKMSSGFPVIEQAYNWRNFATRVSIITPFPTISKYVWLETLKHFGIGWIMVSFGFDHRYDENVIKVEEIVEAAINNGTKETTLLKSLKPQHKTFAKAGTNKGGYVTPFNVTCANVQQVVKDNPGKTVTEIAHLVRKAGLDHYKSIQALRVSIFHWVGTKKMPDIEFVQVEDGSFRLFPKESGTK